VTDETGEPAVRVSVRALRRRYAGGTARFETGAVVTTDDRGMYRLPNLQPGDYVISVPSTQTTIPAAVLDSMMQGLTSGRGVGAAMLDASTSGIPINPTGGQRVGDFILSSGAGMTALPPPPSTDGRLAVYPTMFHPSVTSAAQAGVVTIRSGDERTGVNVQVKVVPALTIRGIVMGPEGPMSNVGIKLQALGSDGIPDAGADVAAALSAADGGFTMLGIPPGEYALTATKRPRPPIPAELASNPMLQMTLGSGFGPSSQTETLYANARVTVGDSDIAGVTVRMTEGARLIGRVTFEGNAAPPPPAVVATSVVNAISVDGSQVAPPTAARGGGPGSRPGQVNQNGEFRTQGYPAGRYLATVTPTRDTATPWTLKSIMAGGRDMASEAVHLNDADITDVIVTFTDRVSTLSGSVRTQTGTPATDGFVILFPADYRPWMQSGMAQRRTGVATIGATGAYTIPRLLPGAYLAIAAADAVAADRDDPTFIEAAARLATPVTIAEGQPQSLDLTVVRVVR
jgi:hypothetical protein